MKKNACHLCLIFLPLLLACSSPTPTTTPTSNAKATSSRSPASFCHSTSHDLAFEGRLWADPVNTEKKRLQLMNAEVQTYVLASELTHDFDAMLDRHVPMERIYRSEVYMQLLATQQIQKKYREELESYFAYRVKQTAGPAATNEERVAAVDKVVGGFRQEFENIVAAKPESSYAKLALLDIQDDLEDLKTFNSTCDYQSAYEVLADRFKKSIQEVFSDRFKARAAQIQEILKTTPAVKNTHKFFAPTASEPGVDVGKLIKNSAQEMREQTQTSSQDSSARAPQANLKIEPSAGSNGNMFGDKFPAKTWALTFDDGPGATTHLVLDNLKKHNMKATFFLISQNLKNPDFQKVAKQTQADGYALGCHSMTHPQIPKLDQAGRTREIVGAKDVFTDFFSKVPGDTPPLFYRLPYGAGVSVPSVRQMIADAKMIHVYWNVDTLDWQDHNPQSILNRAVKQIEQLGRGIILFHDIHPQSVIASELLMQYFEDPTHHIRLVTIPEITDEMNNDNEPEMQGPEKPAPGEKTPGEPTVVMPKSATPPVIDSSEQGPDEVGPPKPVRAAPVTPPPPSASNKKDKKKKAPKPTSTPAPSHFQGTSKPAEF